MRKSRGCAPRRSGGPARSGSLPARVLAPTEATAPRSRRAAHLFRMCSARAPQMRDPCCRKFTFRLYSSFVCCWILPLLTFAPAYFMLSYRDKNGDYSEFELPVCRNSIAFYCVDGATTAGLLRGVAVWPPFFYTVVVGNLYLLHRAKRARDDYIAGRRRENARRVRKDFLTKWESAAIRERRVAREQVIFDKKARGGWPPVACPRAQ